jgi:sugar O-acyltransferase (sialic acid O-acetyltransferase NeuD family)
MIKITGDGGHARVIKSMIDNSKSSPEDWQFIAIGDNKARKMEAKKVEGKFATIAHQSAIGYEGMRVGEGSVVMAGVIIQAGAKIGKHCILNTGCSIDHDCVVGDFVHIAPNAVLCGNVAVGEGALVGANSTCLPGTKIHPWSTVRAGSVVK